MFKIHIARRRILFTEMQDRLEATNCSSEILWAEKMTRTIFVLAIPASKSLITFLQDMIRSDISIHYACCEADIEDAESAVAITSTVGGSSIPLQRVELENWAEPTTIVTSNKPIGLIAALVTLGLSYPGIQRDLAILADDSSGELSEHAKWLVRKWDSTPSIVRAAPEIHDENIEWLFRLFLQRIGVDCINDTQTRASTLLQACTPSGVIRRIDGAHQVDR